MIQSLLIANRGEIACRIIRTARLMGIRTVAVYSAADAGARHVRLADVAVAIGPAAASESYLVGERIIAAALEAGVEAIHPGYGFLSENAAFAQAVLDAGLVWVGPKPESIRAMGLKDAAKARMMAAGVPVTPGYLGEDQSPERLQAEADAIGYPVLIKAVAGGGGKGMRRVDAAGDFAEALGSCRREASASFGDERVLIEKYILSPRHIEVQVFGDTHGNVVHLFERDCSLQRRHQKVIEEAPAPGMDAATRDAVCSAAVRAAKAVDYEGAGTIEFIADASAGLCADRIWFMEMNTRLQVEHPVTEEITGVDLVEWQLRVASGEALPLRQDELAISGHAIEARLYAEDPARGFLPSTGRLDRLVIPGRRVETGVEQGDEVSPFYDPMIAKLVVHAATRAQAIGELAANCGGVEVWPVRTNAAFLRRALLHPDFGAARISTGFIAEHEAGLADDPALREALATDGAVALVAREIHPDCAADLTVNAALQSAQPGNVWRDAIGLRLNASACSSVAVVRDGHPQTIALPLGWMDHAVSSHVLSGGIVGFRHGEAVALSTRMDHVAGTSAGDGAIIAPMPGKITSVEVEEGQAVKRGQRLLTLEAMKMEHALVAPFDGIVADLKAVAGLQVQVDALLARIEKAID